jgi:hypothetical protein
MVDRRSLVVGGGAAALATLVAGISPAAASAVGRSVGTAERVRRVLDTLEVDRGLADIDGVKRQLAESLLVYEKSVPRDPKADDLHAWVQQRVTDLTGRTEEYVEVAFETPQTLALLGFAFAVHTQRKDLEPVQVTQSMPVPALMSKLEADFFSEMVSQMDAKSRNEPRFGELVEKGSTEMLRVITEVAQASPDSAVAAIAAAAKKYTKWQMVGIVMLTTFLILAQGSYSCGSD